MAVSYKKLWKLLIDKEMMKKDLRAMTGVSTTTMSRLSKMKCKYRDSVKDMFCFEL